jgi:hypothetical protein
MIEGMLYYTLALVLICFFSWRLQRMAHREMDQAEAYINQARELWQLQEARRQDLVALVHWEREVAAALQSMAIHAENRDRAAAEQQLTQAREAAARHAQLNKEIVRRWNELEKQFKGVRKI